MFSEVFIGATFSTWKRVLRDDISVVAINSAAKAISLASVQFAAKPRSEKLSVVQVERK